MSPEPISTVIIEDDPMVLEVNRQYMESVPGFWVAGTATSGKEGLGLVVDLKPQLVILDIYLPDTSGLEVLKQIRWQELACDVILVTAARDTETVQSVFRLGAVDYIVKPFRRERFQSTLKRYRSIWEKLNAKRPLSQEEIDGLTAPKSKSVNPTPQDLGLNQKDLPKGLSEITLKQVLVYLAKSTHPLSAEEVAQGIGVSRVSARRYLDYLTRAGMAEVEAQYGSVGRPLNRYRLGTLGSNPDGPSRPGFSTLGAMGLALGFLALVGLVWLALSLALGGCNPRVIDKEQVSPNQRLVIRFSHVVAENTPKGKAAQHFADLVNQHLGDKIEVQVYPNSSLYKDGEEIQALVENKVQMIAPAMSKLTEWFPQWQLFDLPFLFASYDQVHQAMDGPVGERLRQLLPSRGLMALALWDNGFKGMSANRPLRRPEDFRGLTFRIMPSPALKLQFQKLGAKTLPLPFSEVYSALESGQAQGAENPPSNFYSKGFYQLQPYFTVSNHGYLGYMVLVNAKFWQGLPQDIRAQLEAIMAEVTAWERQMAAEENQKALEAMKKAGTRLIYLSPQEEQAWRQALQPIYQELAPVIGSDLIRLAHP